MGRGGGADRHRAPQSVLRNRRRTAAAKNEKGMHRCKPLEFMVAGDGIEPPTRGFSTNRSARHRVWWGRKAYETATCWRWPTFWSLLHPPGPRDHRGTTSAGHIRTDEFRGKRKNAGASVGRDPAPDVGSRTKAHHADRCNVCAAKAYKARSGEAYGVAIQSESCPLSRKRSPTPGSVMIQRGVAASSLSFWRSLPTRMCR